jgi:hypothetical protein
MKCHLLQRRDLKLQLSHVLVQVSTSIVSCWRGGPPAKPAPSDDAVDGGPPANPVRFKVRGNRNDYWHLLQRRDLQLNLLHVVVVTTTYIVICSRGGTSSYTCSMCWFR